MFKKDDSNFEGETEYNQYLALFGSSNGASQERLYEPEISDEDHDSDEDDDSGKLYENHEDRLCGCCDECKWSEVTEPSCKCLKCESCGDCENTCSVGFFEKCRHHPNDCDCDNACECCELCVENGWLESECECIQCKSCLECENTCFEPKCASCFYHVVDCDCADGGNTARLHETAEPNQDDFEKPMAPKRAFRSWPKSEKSILRSLFTSGMPLAEIATHLDRTENAVVVQLANLGLLSEVDLSNAVHQAQLRYTRVTKPEPDVPF